MAFAYVPNSDVVQWHLDNLKVDNGTTYTTTGFTYSKSFTSIKLNEAVTEMYPTIKEPEKLKLFCRYCYSDSASMELECDGCGRIHEEN